MTAKEYLSQIKEIDQQIGRMQRRRDALRASLYSLGSPAGSMNADKVQTTVSGDKMLRLIAQADEMELDIVRETLRLRQEQARIAEQIEGLSDQRYRTILHDRYVLCYKWEQIARGMRMDERWVYRLHGQALQAFADRYLN